MKINPEKFKWLVENVDPTPIFGAITSPDLLQQQAAQTKSGMQEGDYASMLGFAPGPGGGPQPGMTPMAGMMGLPGMEQMMQPTPAARPAPAAAPARVPPMNITPPAVPRGLQPVPQLKQLLGGTRGGSF